MELGKWAGLLLCLSYEASLVISESAWTLRRSQQHLNLRPPAGTLTPVLTRGMELGKWAGLLLCLSYEASLVISESAWTLRRSQQHLNLRPPAGTLTPVLTRGMELGKWAGLLLCLSYEASLVISESAWTLRRSQQHLNLRPPAGTLTPVLTRGMELGKWAGLLLCLSYEASLVISESAWTLRRSQQHLNLRPPAGTLTPVLTRGMELGKWAGLLLCLSYEASLVISESAWTLRRSQQHLNLRPPAGTLTPVLTRGMELGKWAGLLLCLSYEASLVISESAWTLRRSQQHLNLRPPAGTLTPVLTRGMELEKWAGLLLCLSYEASLVISESAWTLRRSQQHLNLRPPAGTLTPVLTRGMELGKWAGLLLCLSYEASLVISESAWTLRRSQQHLNLRPPAGTLTPVLTRGMELGKWAGLLLCLSYEASLVISESAWTLRRSQQHLNLRPPAGTLTPVLTRGMELGKWAGLLLCLSYEASLVISESAWTLRRSQQHLNLRPPAECSEEVGFPRYYCPTHPVEDRENWKCIRGAELCNGSPDCHDGQDEDPTLCLFHLAERDMMNEVKNVIAQHFMEEHGTQAAPESSWKTKRFDSQYMGPEDSEESSLPPINIPF